MDTLESMQAFVAIVEKGSLIAAAKVCNISATMVGNHLRALEKRLGARLINRTTRSVHLTGFGEEYFPKCQQILRLIAESDVLAQDQLLVPAGKLRISAPVSFGTQALVPALSEYMALYPEVRVQLTLADRVVDLVEEGFEAAIRIGTLPDSGLIARPLAPYRMIICASPDYLQRRGTPREPEELGQHECLSFSQSALTDWRLKSRERTVRVAVGGHLQINNGQALRIAALHGVGIVMQPAVLLEADIREGRLVQLFADYELTSRPMHLVYLPDRYRSSTLSSFVNFMLERFA
ncbi:HTH-type transcriptional regulator DmlR [Pseudomonas fluorescens]|uniref:HTH-type transcriptional regulator DmlR n=1 Tax=Pseudomonas fluorescens TaxID=294 RepID=A0A5E7WQ32_PSEFL|nr:LysR family transcriptional regulator [Pseudomonas fluorescens]VVQ37172.1 HTH-type transcriptional regulator DmlR [Pseudomonas fluorescens]